MKKIFIYLLIISSLSCQEDNNIFDDLLDRGGFIAFAEEIPETTFSILDKSILAVNADIVDPNNNATNYSLALSHEGTTVEDFIVINSFPNSFTITGQMILDALGLPEDDVTPDTKFDFVAKVTTPLGVFMGGTPSFNNTTNEQEGGDINSNLTGPGHRSAMSFTIDFLPPNTVLIPITDSSDDAEEGITGNSPGSMDIGSSDLEFGETEGSTRGVEEVGLRFNNIPVPVGATVFSASIQFTVDEDVDTPAPVIMNIYAEATDNATTFEDIDLNLSSRPVTTATVEWDIPVWTTVGDAGDDQKTVDIKTIIQEIIDRPGWAQGNSINIIFKPTAATLGNATESGRVAEAVDGNSSAAPTLILSFID